MSSERSLQLLTGFLCILAWNLESQSSGWPALLLSLVALMAFLGLRQRAGLFKSIAWVGLFLFGISFSDVLRLFSFQDQQRPLQSAQEVAEGVQARFSELEKQLAAWSHQVARQSSLQDTLQAYAAGFISETQARRQLFEFLPTLVLPSRLAFLREFLGLSIHGSSHELLAWSGEVVESFDADFDQVGAQGVTFYIEELSLSSIKVIVPIPGAKGSVGLVAIDLIIQKPESVIETTRFPRLIDLLEPPAGYAIEFTPKDQEEILSLGQASDGEATISIQGLSGESLGTLSVRRLEFLSAKWFRWVAEARDLLWAPLMGWLVFGTFAAWVSQLGARSRQGALFQVFFLSLYAGLGLLSAHEIAWLAKPPVLPSDIPHRLSLICAILLSGTWISLRHAGGLAWQKRAPWSAAAASGLLFFLLLTLGFRGLVWFIQHTSIEVWSPVRPTEILPRLLGHFTMLTGFAIGCFGIAILLPLRRSLWSVVALVAGGSAAIVSGASFWSAIWLFGVVVVLAFLLKEDFAHLRIRLLPAALGGLLLSCAMITAYYPTFEESSFVVREQKAKEVAAQVVQAKQLRSDEILEAELQRLLDRPGLCQDLARKDSELIGGLAAHYWVESGLSEQRAWQSSLTLLRFDGTPVSSFSTIVREAGQPQAEFLTMLLRAGQKSARAIDLEDRTLQLLGGPLRCGGVQVGFIVLAMMRGDFVRFYSSVFEPGEVRAVELRQGAVVDPDDPRLLPPITAGERQVGNRRFRVHLLPVENGDSFDQLAVLIRLPTPMKRLYNFLWACLGSAVYLTLGIILASAALRLVRPRSGPQMGLILRFADKVFLGFLAVSLVPVLIIAPVYRRILEDRLESNLKERGGIAADAAETMILDKGIDNALTLAERIIDPDGQIHSEDLVQFLSRDPVVAWSLYGTDLNFQEGDAFQPHEILKPPVRELREAVALGQPVASFASSQGQTVLQVIIPLSRVEQNETRLLAVLCLHLHLFRRATDEFLLQVKDILGYEVELYSSDGYLQASSRWPELQISSPSRRIHSEAFYFIGVLGSHRHTVLRKEAEQYRNFTTYRACLDRSSVLSGFLAVSIGLPAGEELASELRNMGLIIFLVAFAGFLLSTLVATILVGRISRPLWELMRGTSQVAGGDLQIQLQKRGDDEIARLVDAFNSMVDQLRAQRDELARTHRLAAWGEAARRVAHEIKNPLTPILLSTQHLRQVWQEKSPKFDQLFQRCTDTIMDQVKSLQHIATEFSRFARLPAPKLEPGELNEAVKMAVSVFQGTIPERIHFEVNLHTGSTRCQVDAEAISRAVVNLIQNAIHAIEEEGTVAVVTRPFENEQGRFVRLTVTDTGSGISEEILPRLFEPYFSTKVQGTGLGLAIAKRTFDDHHCVVHVTSNRSEGTIFDIDFPSLP